MIGERLDQHNIRQSMRIIGIFCSDFHLLTCTEDDFIEIAVKRLNNLKEDIWIINPDEILNQLIGYVK